MAGDESDSDAYSDDGDEDPVEQTPGRALASPAPESSSESSEDEDDSEDDSREDAPGESESPVGDSDSDSEDTSVDGEDESEDEPTPLAPQHWSRWSVNLLVPCGMARGRKQLESRVEVISPPTSPEPAAGIGRDSGGCFIGDFIC